MLNFACKMNDFDGTGFYIPNYVEECKIVLNKFLF